MVLVYSVGVMYGSLDTHIQLSLLFSTGDMQSRVSLSLLCVTVSVGVSVCDREMYIFVYSVQRINKSSMARV